MAEPDPRDWGPVAGIMLLACLVLGYVGWLYLVVEQRRP